MSKRSKPNKSDKTNQSCQVRLLIESGEEVLKALKDKINQNGQRWSQNVKFGGLIESELEQVPSGRIKYMLKLDIQKLIFQAKYTNLQIKSNSERNQNSWDGSELSLFRCRKRKQHSNQYKLWITTTIFHNGYYFGK